MEHNIEGVWKHTNGGCPEFLGFRQIKEPHIICLAAAKHYRLRHSMTAKAWIISLVKIGDRKDKFVAKGETFWEAEKIARNFIDSK